PRCAALALLTLLAPAIGIRGAPTGQEIAHTFSRGHTQLQIDRADNVVRAATLADSATGFDWATKDGVTGPCAMLEGKTLAGFDGDGPFQFAGESARKLNMGGQELITHWTRPDGLKLDWSISQPGEVGVVRYRAVLRNSGTSPLAHLTEFGPLVLRLRGDLGPLKFHWLNRSSYRMQQADFTGDFSLSGGSWNAPDAAGWLAIENEGSKEVLFVGIEWESYWRFSLKKDGADIVLKCGLERFDRALAPGEAVKSPVVFLGVTHGDLDDSVRDLHDYLRQCVLPPNPAGFPWVTYDIWGTESSGVESGILSEIAFAKEIGVEVFYHDAGWYEGSAKNGSGDWFTGVGNWEHVDRAKLPHGLAYLSDKVHEAGMKFGLWFAPQVVDSALVGKVIPERWLAKNNGKTVSLNLGNGWAAIDQICLGDPEVVEHLEIVMASAVEKYHLDWLKWDNSGLPGAVCNRADHGHAPGNGALAALSGEYAIYQYLHRKFPRLILENCGYPSRVDYGLAQYARANWLSDDTTDALRCRRSQIHGSYAFPASHNTAWIVNYGEIQNEKDPDILDTFIRSRMIGLFGMGTLGGKLSERLSLSSIEVKAAIKRNIANYKKYRHLLDQDVYHVLPLATKPEEWDAVQFCRRDGAEAVLLTFRGKSAEAQRSIHLRGLSAQKEYALTSLTTGEKLNASGAALMSDGVHVSLPKLNQSEIYLIRQAK
ncbi:MAG: alpha-galactosidase, partial [Candidatus Omnitrophica bacterium]|nr:alpha-galactosidase [Candidatus Omnitrophota bacterium]